MVYFPGERGELPYAWGQGCSDNLNYASKGDQSGCGFSFN